MHRLFVFALLVIAGCNAEPRPLDDLMVRDSTYVEPETGVPYSGPVFRAFEHDPERIQLEGTLLDGEWDGELRVFHANGRIRYMGSFAAGERCGPWTENLDSLPPVNLYDELVRDIESMGIYPPCT